MVGIVAFAITLVMLLLAFRGILLRVAVASLFAYG